jgi:Ser/Thr protein kinase RdoA (MazF antagonist)
LTTGAGLGFYSATRVISINAEDERIAIMGVIYKMLARNENLKKPRHRNLFVDMEENIHIHYRDLRIELSRNEFEDFARIFKTQSAELLELIEERNYQDGVLPNSNINHVAIRTDSRLANSVKYNPKRISIEECSDGYHLHFRNYKLLLDREDFMTLMTAFTSSRVDGPYAATPHEIDELLEANHVHYTWKDPNGPSMIESQQYGQFIVARYHELKIRGIFTGIGMTREMKEKVHRYSKEGLVLDITYSDNTALFADKMQSQENPMIGLTEYLARERPLDPDLLNAIKARVLDTFSFVRKAEKTPTINLDYRSWIYDTVKGDVVFPFSAAPLEAEPKVLYRQWNKFLAELDMYFVKPSKVLSSSYTQKNLKKKIYDRVKSEVADVEAVSKVYIMGSVLRAEMGNYTQPFIHSEWAKMGSDADILIEIDEGVEVEIPEAWNYVNFSPTKKCDIYHIGEIDAHDKFSLQERYPNIDFFDHLLDAYLYFPSRGDKKFKDEFLQKFKAELIYDRDNGGGYPELHKTLNTEFEGELKGLKRMDVTTDNDLYEFKLDGKPNVLKIYKVSGNYESDLLVEHTKYEATVIRAVEKRGIETASVIMTKDKKSVLEFDDGPGMVFAKLEGKGGREPDFPINEAALALAEYHMAQKKRPLKLETDFSFEEVFDMWHPEYHRFEEKYSHDEDIKSYFTKLEPIFDDLQKIFDNLAKKKGLLLLHNHGDMTPRNVIVNEGKGYLFDFQNAFFGPRIFDLIDAAIEFSFGTKNPDFTDFSRYQQFVDAYAKDGKLTGAEQKAMEDVLKIHGIIKFVKEVRMIEGSKNLNNLRRRRAMDLGDFLAARFL